MDIRDTNTLDLILFIISVVLPIMVSLAASLYQILLEHLPAAKRTAARQVVAEVVAAVEQANAGVPGPAKKQIAEQLIGVLAREAHVAISPSQLDVLLEAAVGSLNAAQRTALATTPQDTPDASDAPALSTLPDQPINP